MKNVKRTIRLVKKSQPQLIKISFIATLLESLLPLLDVYLSAQIVSSLLTHEMNKTIIVVAFTLGLNLIFFLIKKKIEMVKRVQDRAFYFRQKQITSNKIMAIDYEIIESSEYHDMFRNLEDLHEMTGYRLSSFVDIFFLLFGALIKIILTSLSVIILFLNSNIHFFEGKKANRIDVMCICFIFLVLGTILINMKLAMNRSRKTFEYSQDMLSIDKHTWYYDNIYFDDYRNGKEIRIYNQSEFLGKIYKKTLKESDALSCKMGHSQGVSAAISSVLSNFNVAFMYGIVIVLTLLGRFTIDNIVFNIGVFRQLLNSLEKSIANFVKLKEVMIYIDKYWEFMEFGHELETKEKKRNLKISELEDIEIEFLNVSYNYGNGFSLKNISFCIKKGQKVALVGLNGSGKTTLVKLLCRFYTPTTGEIKLNGVNINEYDKEEYLKLLSVVFQDYKLFSFTIGQNIATNVCYDKKKIEKILEYSGMKSDEDNLLNDFDTYLYNNFGEEGIEVSGGEEQKIAIARALYKDSPILILDEPTAALDPISEKEVYTYINNTINDKTVIYISHRMSACKFADIIIVLENGRLVQCGSHKELLKETSKKYYEMWFAQAQYYGNKE